jgi:hypothetical protein
VGEDGGEGDNEQFTLSLTLSHPGRGIFSLHLVKNPG